VVQIIYQIYPLGQLLRVVSNSFNWDEPETIDGEEKTRKFITGEIKTRQFISMNCPVFISW
jgi:hypothetical protein